MRDNSKGVKMEIKHRKEADYEILKDNHYIDWFLDHNSEGGAGYISYGQFIIHALWKQSKLDHNNSHPLLDQLSELCTKEIDLKQINSSNILKISYCKDMHNNIEGILIRDGSKGCYPLYISNNDRKNGLLQHIDHIRKNWNSIVKVLEQAKEWSPELEEKLDHYYF
jgi:hypothetical protein